MSAVVANAIGRRFFLVRAGRGVLGVAVIALASCSRGDDAGRDTGADTDTTGGSARSGSAQETPDTPTSADSSQAAAARLSWSRVDLGFVSAYVLVRGGEAAVVDTGVGGSAGKVGEVLDQARAGWAGVRHVLLTHKHPDHVGSLGEIADRATGATLYAGAADLDAIAAPRRLRAVDDGDEVFGLQVVASPGHTAGHVAVFDAESAVLVAGDALTNTEGLAGSNPQFTEDEEAAAASVRKLAALRPRVILVGHGPPVEGAATAELERLAGSLG